MAPRENLSHIRHDLESHLQVVLRSTITASTRHSIRSHSPIRLNSASGLREEFVDGDMRHRSCLLGLWTGLWGYRLTKLPA